MSTSENLRARSVEVTEENLVVELDDGSRHTAPITLFPVLADATADELSRWEVIGGGRGIHWPELDEHISVWSIVHPDQTMPTRPEMVEHHVRLNRARRSRRVG